MTVPEHKLVEVFKRKWQTDKLAHFYLLQNKNSVSSESIINDWTKNLILEMTGLDKDVFEKGHSDILWIESDEKETKYSHLDDRFLEVFKHSDYNPLTLKKKIIIVEKCYLISEPLANKLLKTLEDAKESTLFLFLNPSSQSLLDTISSRAIKLNIIDTLDTSKMFEKNLEFEQWLVQCSALFNNEKNKNIEKVQSALESYYNKKCSLYETIDVLKSNKPTESLTFKILSKWMAYSCNNYKSSSASFETLDWWEKQATFHNSSNSRLENLLKASLNS